MDEKKKFGIDETLELVQYAASLIDKIEEAKSDDGKIDNAEIIAAFASTAPEAVKAMWGASEIDDELKDADLDEIKKVMAVAMPALMKLVGMFKP